MGNVQKWIKDHTEIGDQLERPPVVYMNPPNALDTGDIAEKKRQDALNRKKQEGGGTDTTLTGKLGILNNKPLGGS